MCDLLCGAVGCAVCCGAALTPAEVLQKGGCWATKENLFHRAVPKACPHPPCALRYPTRSPTGNHRHGAGTERAQSRTAATTASCVTAVCAPTASHPRGILHWMDLSSINWLVGGAVAFLNSHQHFTPRASPAQGTRRISSSSFVPSVVRAYDPSAQDPEMLPR